MQIKGYFILLFSLCVAQGFGQHKTSPQKETPSNWQMLSKTEQGVYGAEIHKAYEYLKDRQPKRQVVVAVIDGGTDITHEDLKANLWINPGEIPGNGIDDDRNGYIDDIHGWNFLGTREGIQINNISLEADREFLQWQAKFAQADTNKLSRKEKEEYRTFERDLLPFSPLAKAYKGISVAHTLVAYAEQFDREMKEKYPNEKEMGREHFLSIMDKNEKDQGRVNAHFFFILGWGQSKGASWNQIFEVRKRLVSDAEARYREALEKYQDERTLIGDDPEQVKDRFYGNHNFTGESTLHGTHVAGIIGATRDNGIGIDGIADVRLMVLRVTAGKGDEHDKDVANAIRYAVENGANIINMSFGKSLSPHKKWVDDAMKLAEKKGVLIVHAAGNNNMNVDSVAIYPNQHLSPKRRLGNFVNVGSIAPDGQPAISSNYGKNDVDLFAPGVDIYSTMPDGKYQKMSGTSMAAPVVSGVAALIWNYFPELSLKELKQVLLEGTTSRKGEEVLKPQSRMLIIPRKPIRFEELCASAGIVNALKAVQLAEKMIQNK